MKHTVSRLILAIAAAIVILGPIAVWAASEPAFLIIKNALVRTTDDRVDKAAMTTHGTIPKDGSKGAFGYGVITGNAIIVTTTHKGVLDSKAQNGNPNNPIFHNHYVILGEDKEHCGDNLAVKKITFSSPGNVNVGGSSLALTNLPKSSEGLTQNSNVKGVVSFVLEPIFTGSHLDAVCVTHTTPAEHKFVS